MRKLFIALAAALCSAAANAQQPVGYFEGSVGGAFINNINTDNYTVDVFGDVFSGHAELDYGTKLTVGAEMGFAGFAHGALRWGLSYDYVDARLDSAALVGTLNGVPTNLHVSRQDLNDIGLDLDNNVHIVAFNGYYNLPFGGRLQPYLGVGAGMAFFDNADPEFALSGTAGLRWGFADNQAYIGVRYRFYRIAGPEDDLHIKYDPIIAHTLSAMVGVYL